MTVWLKDSHSLCPAVSGKSRPKSRFANGTVFISKGGVIYISSLKGNNAMYDSKVKVDF